MKKLLFILFNLFIILGVNAQHLSLEEVLEKHYHAINQENRNKVNNIMYRGTLQQELDFAVELILQRPGKVRMEVGTDYFSFVQVYDGKKGYYWEGGESNASELDETQVKNMRDMATVDSEIYTAEKRGHRMQLLGRQKVENRDAYLIRSADMEERETIYFLDATDFILYQSRTKAMVNGEIIEGQTEYDDYREVEGMLFPTVLKTLDVDGNLINKMVISDIELNTNTSDALFSKP